MQRYRHSYEVVRDAASPHQAIASLSDEHVVYALVGAQAQDEPYLANVLAVEVVNRVRRATTGIHHLGDGVVGVDATGRVRFTNPAVTRILGWERQDLAGRHLHDAFHPGCRGPCPLFTVCSDGALVENQEAEFARPHSGPVTVECTAAPVTQEDQLTGAVLVFRDVSERKRAEGELRTRVAHLEVLHALTESLAGARTLDRVFETALDGIANALACERASVLLVDDAGVMRFRAWRGISDEYRRAVDGHSPWNRDTQDPPPVLVANVEKEPSLAALLPAFRREGIRALGFFPLAAEGRLLGKFMVYHAQAHEFAEDEVRLALSVARGVALAVARERGREAVPRITA